MAQAGDSIVYVVDDDPRIRDALALLMSSYGLDCVGFGSAADYMAYPRPDLPACLILDVRLPDMNGLELQGVLAAQHGPRVVFITGHGDIPSTVRAMRSGAVDFLTKPFSEADLMRAIRAALAESRLAWSRRAELAELRSRLARLTPRERELLGLVVDGLLNKQAAAVMGISENTVQIYRGNIMRKMAVDSLADLVRIAGKLEIPVTLSRRSPGAFNG